MIRITHIKRRPDGTIEKARIVPKTRRDCRRLDYVNFIVYGAAIPMAWASLFHLLKTDAARN